MPAPFLKDMGYITLGEIRQTYGLKGGVRCFSLTDFAKERFKKGTTLYLVKGDERKEVTVERFQDSGNYYFLFFNEIKSIEEAEPYRGFRIEIDEEKAPLPKDYVRLADLVGCKVIDEATSEELGTCVDVTSYAPTKNLKIKKKNGGFFYVPFVSTFIKEVDTENKVITLEVVEGML